MSKNNKYVSHVQLECISWLYPDIVFRTYSSNDYKKFIDYDLGGIMCNLYFLFCVLIFSYNINTKNSFILPKSININT